MHDTGWKDAEFHTASDARAFCHALLISRFQVCVISDADMTTLGECLWTGENLEVAKSEAASHGGQFGAAIVDTTDQTIDWGHAVSRIGEVAPSVNG